ncbi:uncharacterized protein JCM6883_000800 [Sporobolomyces salmoneus]|uniref:uncharacterized protein n=1 Tax=Sporobolomyces salmoneus TaxID=183962 RepID=UPI003182701A
MTSTPSAPLLGTPYILSQSQSHPSSTTTTQITPPLCNSLTQFKRLLSSSRSLDDAITTRLNRANALSRGDAVGGGECEKVWSELKERWSERNRVLSYCDQVLSTTTTGSTSEGSRRREETGLSAEKGELGRGRSTESEIKRQQLHQEFSIERIIRQRTLNLLASRCPSLATTTATAVTSTEGNGSDEEAVRVPRAIGEETEEEERKRRRGRDERGGVRWA